MAGADGALLQLLRRLDAGGYRFVAPTPATHARVLARPDKRVASDLRDIFGWSLPFAAGTLPGELAALLDQAGMMAPHGPLHRSLVRVASLGPLLFLHSAYPTEAPESVFLGPDSYRFARFVLDQLASEPAERLIDIGAGAGVGAIVAARAGVRQMLLTDVNPFALRLARINAAFAGVAVETRIAAGADETPDGVPLAIMNPPFIADDSGKRAYRDGGGALGAGLSIDWALAAARRIAPGGRVLLYSGSAIVAGRDGLEAALRAGLPSDCRMDYAEIDPDIFGEELERPAYAQVERIAAIGAVIRRDGRR